MEFMEDTQTIKLNCYIYQLLRLLEFTKTKINSCELSESEAIVKIQYYEFEEEIVIDYIINKEGIQIDDVSCYYKRFNQPLSPIGWNELFMEIFSKSLEV